MIVLAQLETAGTIKFWQKYSTSEPEDSILIDGLIAIPSVYNATKVHIALSSTSVRTSAV